MDEPPSLDFLLPVAGVQGSSYPVIYFLAASLLLILAFISASKVAFVSISHDEFDGIRKNFTGKANTIPLFERNELLARISLLGIIVRISLVTILVFVFLGEPLELLPASLPGLFGITGMILSAELIPKPYAQRYALPFARLSARLWWKLLVAINPIVKLFSRPIVQSKTLLSQRGNSLDESAVEQDILTGIAAFGKLTVRQVMRSRTEISAVDYSLNFRMLMDVVDKCGFSRIPVYRNTIDTIEGVLYIKDLLPFLDHPGDFQWRSLVRPGFLVPENRKIDSLLKDFQDKRVHMAIVVDEHGKTTGLITLEDLIEEIIGEINDEFDDIDPLSKNRETTGVIVHVQG